MDPPRREAKESVRTCRKAGIKTVMITGDHKVTACAAAKAVGIFREGDLILSGQELDAMNEEELRKAVEQTTVYARVSPRHKLRIVRALKQNGHIAAMTGDGVNDAPAIKEADIGVSMGISGTDVTKEAADVILLDDNFSTLVAAVEEGRVIYQNIRKFIRYLLSCNIGEVLTMFLGILMGMPMVLMPIHILLVNLVTDGLPAIALGLEPPEEGVMNRPPRKSNEGVFSGGLLSTILFRGCLIGLTTLGVFVHFLKSYQSVDLARTAALVTLVFSQLIHVFECKSEDKTLLQIHIFNNIKLVLAVLCSAAIVFAAIYFPPFAGVMSTIPLTMRQLCEIAAYLVAAPVLAGALQRFFKSRERKNMLTLPMRSDSKKEKQRSKKQASA
jgi:Ca2+-transporting ATPase